VHIAGITPDADATWMKQVCRNLMDCGEDFLTDASHVIVDRDTSFIVLLQFLQQHTATEIVLLPSKSSNLNAYMERWFRSLKSECLDRMIFFGQRSFERALTNFLQHYHAKRSHQRPGNGLIEPNAQVGSVAGSIECGERIRNSLNYDQRRDA